MNINKKSEKDPQRCGKLRSIEREIRSQLRAFGDSLGQERGKIRDMRAQRKRLKDKAKNIEILIAGATAASGFAKVGKVIDAIASANFASQLSGIRSEIDILERQIQTSETEIRTIESLQNSLQTSLKQNSDELGALNCVI